MSKRLMIAAAVALSFNAQAQASTVQQGVAQCTYYETEMKYPGQNRTAKEEVDVWKCVVRVDAVFKTVSAVARQYGIKTCGKSMTNGQFVVAWLDYHRANPKYDSMDAAESMAILLTTMVECP